MSLEAYDRFPLRYPAKPKPISVYSSTTRAGTYRMYTVVWYDRTLTRRAKNFARLDAARDLAAALAEDSLQHPPEESVRLVGADCREYLRLKEEARLYGLNLGQVADQLRQLRKVLPSATLGESLAHLVRAHTFAPVTIEKALEQWAERQRMRGKSESYVVDVANRLKRFARAVSCVFLHELKAEDCAKYLSSIPGEKNRRNTCGTIGMLLNFAKESGHLPVCFTLALQAELTAT